MEVKFINQPETEKPATVRVADMETGTAGWLQGQIDAVENLARVVANTVALHSPEAAAQLDTIKYGCNRAWKMIQEAKSDG